jgi:hypothetical protein
MNKVYAYYRALINSEPGYVKHNLVFVVLDFLAPTVDAAALRYLVLGPLERLLIGLDAHGQQICGQCLHVRPYGDFNRLLDRRSKCSECRAANIRARKEIISKWKAERRNGGGDGLDDLRLLLSFRRSLAQGRRSAFSGAGLALPPDRDRVARKSKQNSPDLVDRT